VGVFLLQTSPVRCTLTEKGYTFKKPTPTFGSSLPAGVDELMFTTTNQND
jgi:hypothetical protein